MLIVLPKQTDIFLYFRSRPDKTDMAINNINDFRVKFSEGKASNYGVAVSGDGKKIIAATPSGFGFADASAGQSVSGMG